MVIELRVGWVLGALALVTGCGAEPGVESDADSPAVVAVERELTLGSAGEDVRTLHRYLTTFGYFPNAELQRAHPFWRPVVDVEPASSEVFDEFTEVALLALQRNFGLEPTGVVDAATRAVVNQPRCGFPDNVVLPDDAAKWDLGPSKWGKNPLWWKVENTDGDLSIGRLNAIVHGALQQFFNAGAHTFGQAPAGTTPDIRVRFASLAADVLGEATRPADGGDVTMNSNVTWSADDVGVSSGTYDAPSVLLHELGHALGITHSGDPNVVMYAGLSAGTGANSPASARRRILTTDDVSASLARNIEWTHFDTDNDIDIAPNFQQSTGIETLWVLGGAAVEGGRQIWTLKNKQTWALMPGGAVRIAVNPLGAANRPWAIANNGSIWRWESISRTWQNISGCGIDIAVGPDDAVWVIGCNAANTGGNAIYKLTGDPFNCSAANNCWTAINGTANDGNPLSGGAVRIAAAGRRTGSPNTRPWLVDSGGKIWRGLGSNGPGEVWEQLPGTARDIGAGSGQAWIIGTTAQGDGNFSIHVWQENDAHAEADPPAVARTRWIKVPGGGTGISVGGDGHPYVVTAQGSAWYAY